VRCCQALLLLATATSACAHENLPASLLLQESASQVFEVRWRLPQAQGQAPDIAPLFPSDCVATAPVVLLPAPGARLTQWQIRCSTDLRADAHISIDGLPLTLVDTLVRIVWLDGTTVSAIARPRAPEVSLAPQAAGPQASAYFGLGVEHILSGLDHLLFVFCLVLMARDLVMLLKTVTAFTLAHSLTLALAALGVVHIPPPPVEAMIALSILFVARELVRGGAGAALTQQRPWAIAFVFGLLHGFGFAGALSEVGLPAGEVPLALLLFNVGVEAGQLVFIAVTYPLVLWARQRLAIWPAWLGQVPVYAVGGMAGFWWLQRMVVVLGLRAF
jgi:hydrogenase/urease accessory protein HupE